jgi:hypothetical protein
MPAVRFYHHIWSTLIPTTEANSNMTANARLAELAPRHHALEKAFEEGGI